MLATVAKEHKDRKLLNLDARKNVLDTEVFTLKQSTQMIKFTALKPYNRELVLSLHKKINDKR